MYGTTRPLLMKLDVNPQERACVRRDIKGPLAEADPPPIAGTSRTLGGSGLNPRQDRAEKVGTEGAESKVGTRGEEALSANPCECGAALVWDVSPMSPMASALGRAAGGGEEAPWPPLSGPASGVLSDHSAGTGGCVPVGSCSVLGGTAAAAGWGVAGCQTGAPERSCPSCAARRRCSFLSLLNWRLLWGAAAVNRDALAAWPLEPGALSLGRSDLRPAEASGPGTAWRELISK